MFPPRLWLVLKFLCFLIGAYAQVLYDNPPIGVPLTRPIFPWLARVYVKSGEQRTFLDAAPPNLSGNGTQKLQQGQQQNLGPNSGSLGGPNLPQQPPNQPPPPDQTQLQPYGPTPTQTQIQPFGFSGEFGPYPDGYANFAAQHNFPQTSAPQPLPGTEYGYPSSGFAQPFPQDPQTMYQQQIAQQQQQQQYFQQQSMSQPNPMTPYGPNINPGVYSQVQQYGPPPSHPFAPQPNSPYGIRYSYSSPPSQQVYRFSSVPMLQTQQGKEPIPNTYPASNSVLPVNDRLSYGPPLSYPPPDSLPYQPYDSRASPPTQQQPLSPLPTLTSDPVLGPPPSSGVPNHPYAISYPGNLQQSQISDAQQQQQQQPTTITAGYYNYNTLPSSPNRFHDFFPRDNVVETPFGTASTSTLSILKELAVALEKVTRNQKALEKITEK